MKKMFSPIVTPSTAIALLLAAGSVHGATLTWDDGGASPTAAVDGTSSVWDTSTAVWSNGATDSAWVNANNDIAVFGNQHGTAGTVNLGANITVGGLIFNAATSGNYTIAPGTGPYTLTLAGGASITTNVNAAISTVITGTSGLTKSGTGTLTLSATNTYTGLTTISQGMLIVSATNALGSISSGTVAIDGGALRYTVSGTIGTLSAGLNGVTVEENGATLNINNLVYSGAGDRTLTFGGAVGTVSLGSAALIKDSGGVTSLVKNGAGTLQLNGTNTYTGPTYINGGVFRTNATAAIPTTTTVYLAKGATFDMTNGSQTIGVLLDGTDGNGGGRVSVNKGGLYTFTVGSGNFSGLMNDWAAGTGKLMQLTKSGTGTLTLSGTSAYSGTTSVTGGSLKLTSVKAMNYGAVLGLGVSVAPTTVSGGGNLDLSMNGTVNQVVTLNGGGLINSTAGTTATLDNGIAGVQFSNGGTGYTGNALTFTGGGGSGASATYTLSSGSITGIGMTAGGTGYTSAPTVSGSVGSGLQATAVLSSVSLTGTSNTIGGDGNLVIAAVISGANGGFTKSGTGTLTLKGANTYSGVTDIAAGKLALAGTGSIANSATIKVGLSASFDVSAISGFTVGASQTLDNNGSITGNVSVAGTLSGNGTISNGLSLLPASTLDLQLNKSGNTHDTVTVLAGDVSLAGTLNLLLNGGSLQVGTGLVLVINSGNGALTESFTDVTIGGVSVGNYADHTFTYSGQEYLLQSTVANGDGVTNDLEIIAVPEPNTWGLILGGTGVLVGLQRLRRTNRRLV